VIYIGAVDISAADEAAYQQLYRLASQERRERADRYLRKEDAHRCIIADGLLRYALRQALGTDQVALAQTSSGKPFIPDREDFHFNLSHSGRWVVIAWADCPMGIDVETVLMDGSKENLARRFFHADEQTYLFSTDGEDRAKRFFEIWTKKESYLKYLGAGINRPLDSFSVLAPLGVGFHCRMLEDAVLSLCAEKTECRLVFLTQKMLLCV